MADQDLNAIANVSATVLDYISSVYYTRQCIGAQDNIVKKLKSESERNKEQCISLKNENLKLEAEIRHAEATIKRIGYDSITSAETELKKELLATETRKSVITHRVNNGEKKYDELWLQLKERFESSRYVQKLLQVKKSSETLKENMNNLENETRKLRDEIKAKKIAFSELDKQQILQLAQFLTHARPASINTIHEKLAENAQMAEEIDDFIKKREANKLHLEPPVASSNAILEDNCPNLCKNDVDSTLLMPKLQFANADLDVLSEKLHQIKKVTVYTTPPKRTDSGKTERILVKASQPEDKKSDDYFSAYFTKPTTVHSDDKQEEEAGYRAKRKLIHILEDLELNEQEAFNIVSRVNPETLQAVEVIDAGVSKKIKDPAETTEADQPMEAEEIEEIDLTNTQNILIPPTQFLDLTQEIKTVSFDVPMSVKDVTDEIISEDIDETIGRDSNETSETVSGALNVYSVAEDNYDMRIKDIILKKQQLDLSPQFVYAKSNILQKRNDDDKVVTSKFFEQNNKTDTNIENKDNLVDAKEQKIDEDMTQDIPSAAQGEENPDKDTGVSKEDSEVITTPKGNISEKPVTGFLFSHGLQGVSDCLDASINTTGCEDYEGEFPNYLDSSFLLSPKADLPVPMSSNNAEVGSQELPNFLTGFRKAGLSFFGKQPTPEENPESNAPNRENNFNFNFGGEEKKNKGGLFSFFR